MKAELKLSLNNLKSAYARLDEVLALEETQIVRDATIQRYEFTFELLWKTLKMYLRYFGINAHFPRDVLKEAYKSGWILEEEPFLNMLNDRNIAAHEYNFEKAQAIFIKIKTEYAISLLKVIEKMDALVDLDSDD